MGWLEDAGNWITKTWEDATGITAANTAAQAQIDAAKQGITAVKDAQGVVKDAMNPYTTAGVDAMKQQRDLMGLNGPEAQKAALAAISDGSEMDALAKQGEDALL